MVLYQTGKRIYIELTQNDVLLAQNLAKRCSVNIGESVFVSPVGQVFPMKMHVADIVANHEILIQDAVMNSYVYMDRDALFNALKITEENLDTIGYTKETFGLTLPTYFYINGSNEIQNTILTKLKDICRQNAIDYNKIAISNANDAASHVSEVYGYMDVLLSVFTFINFLMSCYSYTYKL